MFSDLDHSKNIYLAREDDPIDSRFLTRYTRDRGGYIRGKVGFRCTNLEYLHVSHILILLIEGVNSQEVHVHSFHVLAATAYEHRSECCKAFFVPLKCIKLAYEYVK